MLPCAGKTSTTPPRFCLFNLSCFLWLLLTWFGSDQGCFQKLLQHSTHMLGKVLISHSTESSLHQVKHSFLPLTPGSPCSPFQNISLGSLHWPIWIDFSSLKMLQLLKIFYFSVNTGNNEHLISYHCCNGKVFLEVTSVSTALTWELQDGQWQTTGAGGGL